MRKIHLNRQKVLGALEMAKFVLLLLLTLMFISFNAKVAQQTQTTKNIAASTNKTLRGQTDILNAIKAVTDDTHTTAAEQTAIIICMLQVPIGSRTTDLQAQCRKQANGAAADNVSGTSGNSAGTTAAGSSTNSAPNSTESQQETSQNPPSGGSSNPSFFQRNFVQPIKNLINAL